MTVEYAKERKQFGRADRLLPGRLARLRADVPRDRGRAQRRPTGPPGRSTTTPRTPSWPPTAPRPTRRDAAVNVVPLGAAGPRRHRLHLGARPAPVPQARRGQRPRLRRRALAPRAGRGRPTSNAGSGRRRAAWSASSTVRPAPPSGSVTRARGLEHVGLRGARGQLRADQAEQRRAGHVRADRLGRRPRRPTAGGRRSRTDVTLSLIES